MSDAFLHRFLHRHRVTYAECTIGNHVYHSRYLDILEAARGEFMRHVGHDLNQLQSEGFIFPVIEARLTYHRPARYDEVLDIGLALIELTPLRLGVLHEVRRADGTLVLEAVTRHVCTSPEEKPRRMPKPLVSALRPWVLVTASPEGSE
ncbi:MAG: acyl-CoA thioesterase [Verrucomicrobiales bacterium]|nr:acyl-CoA thioesterase [Verrucomicrobiales bacterium]